MWNNTDKIRTITAAVERRKIGMPLFILLGGITVGFLVTGFFMFFKNTYATFLVCGLLAPLMIVIYGNAKRFLLAILTILLPITVDIVLNDTGHISGASGYILSAFDIILAALYLLWMIEIFGKKSGKINFFPQISIPAFFLIGTAALSMVFSRYPKLGMFEIMEIIKMYFCFLYLANNIKSESEVKFVVFFLLVGLLLEGFLGFLQHRYGDPFWPTALGGPKRIDGSRVSGSWRSFNDFSWYLGFVLPIALSVLFSEIKYVYKLLCGYTFLLGGGSLMWSNSRGGWISFAMAGIFVSICVFGKIKGKAGLIKTSAWIMAVAIFLCPLYPRLSAKFYGRLGGDDRGAAESRLPQIEVAYNMIEYKPLIGVGINNYTKVMYDYDDTEEGLQSYTPHAVHNIFFHICAEIGIPGFIVFLWFISVILIEGVKYIVLNKGFMAYAIIGMIGGVIAFLVHGLVDTASLGNKMFMFVWFFAGMIFAVKRIKPEAIIGLEPPT